MTLRGTSLVIPVALVLGFASAAGLSACGSASVSSSVSSVAKQVSTAVSGGSKTETVTKSTSAPTVTKSVSAPTVTKSVSAPGGTTSIGNTTSVSVNAPTTTATNESSGGLPWWAWLLIGLAIAGVVALIYAAGRRRGKDKRVPPAATGGDPPVPPTP